MKKHIITACLMAALIFTACAGNPLSQTNEDTPAEYTAEAATKRSTKSSSKKKKSVKLTMKIGDTPVKVKWNNNSSVKALKKLAKKKTLKIKMSMYGGFEQVGSIGKTLPSHDRDTTTEAGDIVLYSSDQIVVFYGSNTWAYTRLGHITDKTDEELAELLSNGDVTITISAR